MTEMSFFWTTSGAPAGDQVASYTQAQLAIAHAIIAACSGFEGVAPGYSSELACSDGGANTVDVAAGGAVVDGIPYSNSAAVNVNIPSAAGGGNTRIDRIVARASWAGFDVAITRIAGTDAATPTAPAITQTAGTTYDIMLCQVLVDTAGAVTVTDERTWAITEVDDSTIENNAGQLRVKAGGLTASHIAANAVDTSELAADAVTGAKIEDDAVDSEHVAAGAIDLAHMSVNSVDSNQYVDGSIDSAHLAANSVIAGKIADGAVDITASLANDIVDDTKVGDRVPQFYRRQGGHATDWSVQGTTTYTPGSVRMQGGTIRWTGAAAAFGTIDVTFPTAFSDAPLIYATGFVNAPVVVTSIGSYATYVSLYWKNPTPADHTTIVIHWLAIGPE